LLNLIFVITALSALLALLALAAIREEGRLRHLPVRRRF
jgi:hypothetical protein